MSNYPWYGIVGWTYDGSYHCNDHAIARFTETGLFGLDTVDSEGNELHPVHSWDESGDSPDVCDECLYESIRDRPASHSDQDIDNHNATQCPDCDGTGFYDNLHEQDDWYPPQPCLTCNPAQVVTPTGIQYLLPGETPPPARKGDDSQSRMF